MASVQKLKANATKDAVWESEGALASTGSVMDISALTGATNFVSFGADGDGGATVGATMTADPAVDAEDGFLTIVVAGVARQIPWYDA